MWKDFTCVTKTPWLQGNHCQDGLNWEKLSADDLVGYPKETRLWVGAIGMGSMCYISFKFLTNLMYAKNFSEVMNILGNHKLPELNDYLPSLLYIPRNIFHLFIKHLHLLYVRHQVF